MENISSSYESYIEALKEEHRYDSDLLKRNFNDYMGQIEKFYDQEVAARCKLTL